MEQGWIYVLVNSSIPGMFKVGRTTRLPSERAAELSAASGVATPFVIAFEHEFADCVTAEQQIHAELDRRGQRIAPNREFFRGSSTDIVRVVLDAAGGAAAGSGTGAGTERRPEPGGAELLAEGDRHLHGTGETLQDVGEALRCYRLAATRGSVIAMERLGALFAQSSGKGRENRRRAMRYLRDGAKRGNYYCYVEMAWLYAAEGHVDNFTKSWDLFFARRASEPAPEVEAGANRYANALRDYMATCLDLRVPPGHLPELRAAAEPVLECLLLALDELRDTPQARARLVEVLRWAYEHIVPAPPVTHRARTQTVWRPAWLGRSRTITT